MELVREMNSFRIISFKVSEFTLIVSRYFIFLILHKYEEVRFLLIVSFQFLLNKYIVISRSIYILIYRPSISKKYSYIPLSICCTMYWGYGVYINLRYEERILVMSPALVHVSSI